MLFLLGIVGTACLLARLIRPRTRVSSGNLVLRGQTLGNVEHQDGDLVLEDCTLCGHVRVRNGKLTLRRTRQMPWTSLTATHGVEARNSGTTWFMVSGGDITMTHRRGRT